MAVHPPVETEYAEPVLGPAAEALRSVAHCVGILAAGLLAGFIARGIGGGILIDGIALALPAALVGGGTVLAYRLLRAGGPFRRSGSAPAP